MAAPVIRVEGLGKRYRIGGGERYLALRDVLARAVRRPFAPAAAAPFIWALRDVSFTVARGEIVGIVGRNGAGKSTLLRLLARITRPTEGRGELRGRVGTLLDVGTGFHPELTGRENILLAGAVLGMQRAEIARKFDAIVAFAEVDRFIDTPVKHYSTGMFMRLAFAVAAHLEPEILLVDEVLAVGDAAFQKKCLGKMDAVASEGRTVLFVSHNMVAVEGLCRRAIWLDGGRVRADGPAREIVPRYLHTSFSPLAERVWPTPDDAPGGEGVHLRRAAVRPLDGGPGDVITVRTPLAIEFEYWNLDPGARLNLSLHVFNEPGVMVFNTAPVTEPVWHGRPFPAGLYRSTCEVPGDLLNDGTHRIQLLIVKDQGRVVSRQDDVLVFDVRDAVDARGDWHGRWPGAVRPRLAWRTELLDAAAGREVAR
jgi:lipopolysaccharide transport system ATP-binding protein